MAKDILTTYECGQWNQCFSPHALVAEQEQRFNGQSVVSRTACYCCDSRLFCLSSPPTYVVIISVGGKKHDVRKKLNKLMDLINSVLQSPQHYMVLLLLPRADATSIASGSRQSLGTVAPHKHHYILLQFPSHLLIPIFLPPSPSPLPARRFHPSWWTVESYPHYWAVYMMPCSMLRQSTQVIISLKPMGGWKKRRNKCSWRLNALNVSHICACQSCSKTEWEE